MARPYVRNIKPNEAKEIFGNLSQTNHYQVSFSGLNRPITNHIRSKFGIFDVDRFMGTKGGIMCSDASLPSSSLATGEVRNDFIGVPQEFAHTRLYTDIDFTFYIDNDYKILRIFEGWIDYISSGSSREIDELSDNYYRRMRYPDSYKVQSMFISKFEKDYKQQLDYQFVNAFPKLMTAIPVSYGGADILKVSVSFNYDRYIVNPRGRIRQNRAGFDPLRSAVSQETNQRSTETSASIAAFNENLNLGIDYSSNNLQTNYFAKPQQNIPFGSVDIGLIPGVNAPEAPILPAPEYPD